MITNFITAGVLSDLDNITFNDRLIVALLGNTVIGDVLPRIYVFSATSTATANGTSVLRPSMYAQTSGRLLLKNWDDSANSALNSATIGLTKSQLNTQYPNAQPRFMVYCPSIILGGAIYVKSTGNNWQTISAPPTL